MARGVNKVIIVGNIGQDPEVKFTAGGAAITNISVATSESWKDKQTGQSQERTEWHRIVFFNRLAEIAGEYLKKGSKVYIEGALRTRKWQDQSGQDRYTTEIVGNEMQMLDSRNEGDSSGGGHNNAPRQQAAPQQQQAPQQQSQQQEQQKYQQQYQQQPQQSQQQQLEQYMQQAPQQAPQGMDDYTDDIPF